MSFVNDPLKLEKLKKIKCFVLDMDGTFYLGNELLEGSREFYEEMKRRGIRILFLTNNSSRSCAHYVKKLHALGCDARDEDVYTSGMATCAYIRKHYPGRKIALLGNEFLQAEFEKNDILLDFEHPDVVCVGFDTTLDYRKMTVICDHIRAGLPYIATHPDFNCPIENNGYIPDIGAIMAFIEASTKRKADVIIGKPYKYIIEELMALTQLDKESLCICGDRLYTDIATGLNSGILSLCVLTGEATPEDIETTPFTPDLVLNRLYDIIQYL